MIAAVPCNRSDAHCPADSVYLYNSNVALDDDGAVLAVYHKSHMYGTPFLDQPPTADAVTFTLRGVEFGMVCCHKLGMRID